MKRLERPPYPRSDAARRLRRRPWLALVLLLAVVPCAPGRLRADDLTRSVQEELRKRNLYFGDVDGSRTPQLAAALRRYQQRKGFNPTGEEDDTTLRSLSLRPAGAAGFAPPAAAVTVTNPNPASNQVSTKDAADAGGGPDEATVPYWPDTTVLRSDHGHAGSSGAAVSNALNNLTPGSADAISPAGRFNSPPASSSLATQYPTSADVRGFIVRYLQAGQANDPDAEMSFYGDRVNYFTDGPVNRHFISLDIRRYEKRWPQRSFTVVGPVSVVADANDINHTLVHFRYRFTNRNSRFTVSGEVDNVFTLEGSGPDSLRLIGLSEHRVP